MSSDERYYVVETNNGGMHCAPTTCRALAESTAARCNHEYPSCAPHTVLQLVPFDRITELALEKDALGDAVDMYCELLKEARRMYCELFPSAVRAEVAISKGWVPAELWP